VKIVGAHLVRRQIAASNVFLVSNGEDDSPQDTQKDTKKEASVDSQRGRIWNSFATAKSSKRPNRTMAKHTLARLVQISGD
jgi:hypothetical protein